MLSETRKSRWAVALVATAQFMIIMDTSIIGVALPRIRADLGFTQEDLSWVFNAYVVAFGGLLLLGGRLADLLGARRVFTTGWAVLILGSLAAGAAQSPGIELAGRAIQGIGAALIAPSALTLLMIRFGGDPKRLTGALAVYGAAAPAGGTAGVFLGGLITQYLTWPWVFYINVPIAVAVLAATARVLPASPARRGGADVLGGLTATIGLAGIVYAVVRAPAQGWGSAPTLGVLAAGILLLGAFMAIQATRRQPLMRLGIFRAPNLAVANLVQFMLGAAWVPLWFFLNLYLQQVLGLGAFAGGAALLPMTIAIMVMMVALAPRLLARFGVKPLLVTGLLALAAGLVVLSLARPGGSYLVDVLPASLLAAVGQALAFIPSLGTAISAAGPQEGGLASGIVNTSYQVGSALGLAAMTAVAAAYGATHLYDTRSLTTGFGAAFLGAAAIALLGALLTVLLFRTTPPSTGVDTPDPVRTTGERISTGR